MDIFERWREQYWANPQVIFLILFLGLILGSVLVAGDILAPLITSLVFAYVLDGGMSFLQKYNFSRSWSLFLIYLIFISTVLIAIFFIIPLLTEQMASFLGDLPAIITQGHQLFIQLPEKYPEYIKQEYIDQILSSLRDEIRVFGQQILSVSLSSITGFITFLIYAILVPILIFFFLKDKNEMMLWLKTFLPKKEEQTLTLTVFSEVNRGIAAYIRGKLIEIVIIWIVSWIVFALLGLNYTPLLSFLIGISVIIPYIGAAVLAIPVILIAYAQWGFDSFMLYAIIAYAVIQFLDGNLLVPVLFSEVVNLHPVAIISAVVIFGSIWGLWGVFFAIPLATLVNAVLKAWPRYTTE